MLPNESVCINCMLCMEAYWNYDVCKIMHIVSLPLNDFCPCILSLLLCINL